MEDAIFNFRTRLSQDVEMSLPVAVIKTLTDIIKVSNASTMSELTKELELAKHELGQLTKNSISFNAGYELFMRFVTRMALDCGDFESCKRRLLQRGESFVIKAPHVRQQVANWGSQFIRDGSVILIHSYSRTMMTLLLHTASLKIRFKVFVTESRPNNSGYKTSRLLQNAGIPCTVIMDSAVAYVIERVDMVLVGAEGVVENGGIINQIGTYQVAMAAKAAHKPFYATAESFKFVRLFPLNQYDLPTDASALIWSSANAHKQPEFPSGMDVFNPLVDYTPPSYITLLFTDLGVLTPSAVSDELIKLYY